MGVAREGHIYAKNLSCFEDHSSSLQYLLSYLLSTIPIQAGSTQGKSHNRKGTTH